MQKQSDICDENIVELASLPVKDIELIINHLKNFDFAAARDVLHSFSIGFGINLPFKDKSTKEQTF